MKEKTEINEAKKVFPYPTYHNDGEEEVNKKLTLRQKILNTLDSNTFHYAVIGLVMLDLVIILAELLITLYAAEGHIPKNDILHNAEYGLTIVSLLILSIFVAEILIKVLLVGPRYLFNLWHLLDAIVVIASFVLEIYVLAAPNLGPAEGHVVESHPTKDSGSNGHHVSMGLARRSDEGGAKSAKNATAFLVIIRLWKFIRIIHAVAHSVEMKNKAIIERIKKEHDLCDSKIKNYMEIIENLSQEVEDKGKKLNELEQTIQHLDKHNNITKDN